MLKCMLEFSLLSKQTALCTEKAAIPMVRYRPFVLFRSAPGHIQLPFVPHAIRQIQVNQRLIGDAGGSRLPLEVLNGIDIQIDGDLAFQLLDIRIGPRIGEIILVSHSRFPF